MLIFKKNEIEASLLQIGTYNKETFQLVSGILTEELTIGTRRRLQKIQKALHTAYQELVNDIKELKEQLKDKSEEELIKELNILLDEEVKIDVEPIQFSQIENISTKNNYNFELIEKFAA